jgi:type IV pilus assembly protein PilO
MEELLAKYAKIPERIRYPVALAVLIGLVVAHFFLIHAGQQQQLESLEDTYTKLAIDRTEKRSYADNLAKYEARHNELTQSLGTARAMLPDNPDVPQFLAQLGNAARDVGLVIDRFEPRPESYKDFYAEIGFGVNVHGSYHEVGQFIDQVGKIDRIVNVSDLSMVSPKTENQKIIVQGSFLVKTYRFLTPEQLAEMEAKNKKGKK